MSEMRTWVAVVRSFLRLAFAAWATLVLVGAAVAGFWPPARPPSAATHVEARHARRPLRFERNEGQFDEAIRYVARGRDYTASLTEAGVELALRRSPARVRLRVAGGRMAAPVGVDALAGVTNYFVGSDPAKWRVGVGGFGRVRYAAVLPGVDLSFHSSQEGRLEYDLELAAGEDPRKVALAFDGVRAIDLAPSGEAVLGLSGGGEVREPVPVAYQTDARGARTPVPVRYELRPDRTLAFAVGPHDGRRALVIDPVLAYSTFLGGGGAEVGESIAVDSTGAAYFAGATTSPASAAFMPLGPISTGGMLQGSSDAYVAKYTPSGVLAYATYLGGSNDDSASGIAVDAAGSAYIAGSTASPNLPVATNTFAGVTDAFVTKLKPPGDAVAYTRYLGGSSEDAALFPPAIAVDAAGSAYVTGTTRSIDFPLVGPIQGSNFGGQDLFIAKVNPTGMALVYSTYYGGTKDDQGNAIAIDAAGSAYVTGHTSSADFPHLPPIGPREDAFLVKLTPSGNFPLTSISIGGVLGSDTGWGIAVDASNNIYITGSTTSPDFIPPLPPGVVPFQATLNGTTDAFIIKLSNSAPLYATFLGGADNLGPGTGEGNNGGIAVDKFGNMLVTGSTSSSNFPTQLPLFGLHSGGVDDAYVTELNASGTSLLFSTYLGGSGADQGHGIALDPNGGIYVTGTTASASFPIAAAAQPTFGGGGADAFVTKILPQLSRYLFGNVTSTCSGNTIATGGTVTVTSGTCPGCVGGAYTFTGGAADILRVLYAGYHHDGTYDCNSGVRRALVANWSTFFYATCPGQAACSGIQHAWREADGSAFTANLISLIGFGGRTIPGVNPFCNSADAGTGMPSASGNADYADKDPIRIPCDPNDSVCERDGTLGLVLPIVFPTVLGVTVADEYPPSSGAACSACILSQTGGGNAQPCPNGGPLFLGRCFQPATASGDAHCMATRSKRCFGDPSGGDGRVYNLPLKKPVGPEPAKYVNDANGNRMTGSFFRIHMSAPASTSPAGPTCQLAIDDKQVGCLVSADVCSLGDAGPGALGQSDNQEL
jgi:hypothetical protein